MKIIVTGANGFVGQALIKKLLKKKIIKYLQFTIVKIRKDQFIKT